MVLHHIRRHTGVCRTQARRERRTYNIYIYYIYIQLYTHVHKLTTHRQHATTKSASPQSFAGTGACPCYLRYARWCLRVDSSCYNYRSLCSPSVCLCPYTWSLACTRYRCRTGADVASVPALTALERWASSEQCQLLAASAPGEQWCVARNTASRLVGTLAWERGSSSSRAAESRLPPCRWLHQESGVLSLSPGDPAAARDTRGHGHG